MLDMELGTRIDLELMPEGGADCEWPEHWETEGVLGKHHTDTGAQWQITMACPCGVTKATLVICDGAHWRVMKAIERAEKATFMVCDPCRRYLSASDAYVSSVKFG